MRKKMWFGTRQRMTWVNAPAIEVGASRVGWGTSGVNLDGSGYALRSAASHAQYDFAWNLTSRENIRHIRDYADGLYGDIMYWADPFTMDTNALPSDWAAPFLGALDGTVLNGDLRQRPQLVDTPANDRGFPVKSALYTVGAGDRPSVWIPIPPEHVAWFGAHGQDGTGGQVFVQPTLNGEPAGAPSSPGLIPVTSAQRVNTSFARPDFDGILVSLGGIGTITLAGMTVQILRAGKTPATGDFISGQGHAGCTFEAQPQVTNYSAALDKVGMTARLIEVKP